MEFDAGLGQLRHGIGTCGWHFGQVLVRCHLRAPHDPFLHVGRHGVEPLKVARVHLAVWDGLRECDVGQDVLEAKHIKSAHGRVERIRHTLLDRRRCFAPCHWRWVGTDHAVILLQHLGTGHPEFDARQIGWRQNRTRTTFAHRNDAWIDVDIEQRLETGLFDFWVHSRVPEVGCHEVRKALVRTTQVRHVDQINRGRERCEVGQRMLCRLNRATLDFLNKVAARPQLATGGKFDVNLAVGCVLNVLFQVQLHDRIAARGTKHIGCGNRHRVLCRFLAVALFVLGLRCRLG